MAMAQPFLHDAVVALQAPAQAWSRTDGVMAGGVHGLVVADVRLIDRLLVQVTGSPVEPVATEHLGADHIRFTAVLRGLDGEGADPRLRLELDRVVSADGMAETLTLVSGLHAHRSVELTLELHPDASPMSSVKSGAPATGARVTRGHDGADWAADGVHVHLAAPGAAIAVEDDIVRLTWRAEVAPGARVAVRWHATATDPGAVAIAPARRVPLPRPQVSDARLAAWLEVALGDLEALQLAPADAPEDVFLAAGAPWFLTLFGRDSLWAARMLLPIDTSVAEGTLRTLARLQGTRHDVPSAEEPGKIIHELRRAPNPLVTGSTLPPRYYGTVDATPLWVLLLHDAWLAGLPAETVETLLPNLRAALAWLRDDGVRHGFVSYSDASGRGLANQGWKDSGDSVQWQDGRLAVGPIALVEVQGYAYEAAGAGAALLDAAGSADEADDWRRWAADLKARFRPAFWIDSADGGHPAIALDAAGAAVDSLTSNIGHLVGTGILEPADEARVAELLVDPRLDSGFGVRTLATDAAGYWPLAYHGGSVWTHDTAIALHGLQRAGHAVAATRLALGLLDAAAAFGYRVPELHGGDARALAGGTPVPYPAACRPQAWSAAAAVIVATALAPAVLPIRTHARPARATVAGPAQ